MQSVLCLQNQAYRQVDKDRDRDDKPVPDKNSCQMVWATSKVLAKAVHASMFRVWNIRSIRTRYRLWGRTGPSPS